MTKLQPIVAAARAEAARMNAAITRLDPGGTVRMSRDQFVALASLIQNLCERVARQDDDRFDAPLDGIRWWVPLPEHQRVLSLLDQARPVERSPDLNSFTVSLS